MIFIMSFNFYSSWSFSQHHCEKNPKLHEKNVLTNLIAGQKQKAFRIRFSTFFHVIQEIQDHCVSS